MAQIAFGTFGCQTSPKIGRQAVTNLGLSFWSRIDALFCWYVEQDDGGMTTNGIQLPCLALDELTKSQAEKR